MTTFVSPQPKHVIEADGVHLARPEGVVFSRSAELKAIANSKSNSITVYARTGRTGSGQEYEPSCVLQDTQHLQFAHGVDFSHDEKYLVTVARESHSALIYRRKENNTEFHQEPIWFRQGPGNGLSHPSDVAFHPSGRNMVVCNRSGDVCVSFFSRVPGAEGHYKFDPTRSIHRDTLVRYGLALAHGAIYTPDGERLLLCHAHSPKSNDKRGKPSLSAFDWDGKLNRIKQDKPATTYLLDRKEKRCHSMAIHPNGGLVALTDPRFGTSLFRYSRDPCQLELLERLDHEWIPADRFHVEGQGPKGVAFSPDGLQLEITVADHQLYIYEMCQGACSSPQSIS